MATITEDYVSYEVAQLIKEKGFQQLKNNCGYFTTEMVYSIDTNENGEHHFAHQYPAGVYNKDKYIAAPTHQVACKWLREVHQLHISVNAIPLYGKTKDEKGRNTCGLIHWDYIACGVWINEKYSPYQKAFVVSAESNEQAIEKALKFSLENLI